MADVIDERRIIRVSLGYLAVIGGALIGGTIFLASLRSDVMSVLTQIQKHEIMLERNQESIMDLQYSLKEFRESYNRDANRYIRDFSDKQAVPRNNQ